MKNKKSHFRCLVVLLLFNLSPLLKAGEELVLNGGFEEIAEITNDADRKFYGIGEWELGNAQPIVPINWKLQDSHAGIMTMIDENTGEGAWSCQIENGWLHSRMFNILEGDKVKVSLKAKGEGQMRVMFYLYNLDEVNSTRQGLPTVTVETIELQSDWQKYQFDYAFDTPGANRSILAFDVQGRVVLDEISVEKED